MKNVKEKTKKKNKYIYIACIELWSFDAWANIYCLQKS